LLGYAQLSQDALQAAIRELAAVIQQAGHRQRS
jgi:hypothetical protein